MRSWLIVLGFAAILSAPLPAQTSGGNVTSPLVLARQGSYFVGGETKALPAGSGRGGAAGDITVNQMYVQYQVPVNGNRHVPVVMVHGCCLSSKTWETTPDGRMGWSEYLDRKDRSVYLADQVSRARSGFDPSTLTAVKAGTLPNQLPNVFSASHQVAWTIFRFGPRYGEAFKDGQFPVEAVDELYKQMIPDLNALLPTPNPTWTNMAALAVRLKGAILMGHSESGFFPQQAALIDPTGIRGNISIEMPCVTSFSAAQLATLAKIPTLIMFGDHLGDVQGGPANWAQSFEGCQQFVKQLKSAGGDAAMMHLPALGIRGNSHMLMQDRNSNQLADLVLQWIDAHVEKCVEGEVSVKSLLDEALDAWQFARDGVIAEVKNLPEAAMTSQVGARTVSELVHHIAESGLMMAGELSRPDGDFLRQTYLAFLKEYAAGMARPMERAGLVALLEQTHADGVDRLRRAGEPQLLQPIRQFNGEPARRLTWMHHGIGHEEYHRGQIALIARVLGHVPALTKLIHGE